jgi:predicted Zn-dependent peptidase
VFDDFEDLFFSGSQLGHNILGKAETLPTFTSQVCRNYIETCYTPNRMVAFYRGSMSPKRVFDIVTRHFGEMPTATSTLARIAPTAVAPFAVRRNIDSHQAHSVLGAPVPGLYSNERIALGLLTNLLGGPGMNSRLNISLRERRGLVYTVEANLNMMSDCGLFNIYFGCDPDDANRCTELVNNELHRIATEPLTPRALRAAKQQYLGQLIVATDNREQMALNAARSTMFFNQVHTPKQVADAINALTADNLLNAAQHLQPLHFSQLTLG